MYKIFGTYLSITIDIPVLQTLYDVMVSLVYVQCNKGYFSLIMISIRRYLLSYTYLSLIPLCSCLSSATRRQALTTLICGTWNCATIPICLAEEARSDEEFSLSDFRSLGYNRREYTNSIVASRDTNISPSEVYDTLLKLKPTIPSGLRALDVGAGAGVSTEVLWRLGYRNIDALDWSGDAWRINVVEQGNCPKTVRFFEMDDERFYKQWKSNSNSQKYDAIAFNFAVNRKKALKFSKELLNDNGILLAPINTQEDYWLKQAYTLFDSSGHTLWVADDVGAWSVLFQPDVTQDTCQGIWCAPFNGFQKLE
jgi:SAM-dependent methyltransferase